MQLQHHQESRDNMTGPVAITLAGYEMLRLQPRQWRRLFDFLLGPAVRLHGLRNASTRVWREALCEIDCPDPASPRSCPCE